VRKVGSCATFTGKVAADVTSKHIWAWGTAMLLWLTSAGLRQAMAAQQSGTHTNLSTLPETNRIALSIRTNYYVFGGTNYSQMRTAMLATRPWKQTLSFDARTKWQVRSNYRMRREGDGFRLNSVRVKTEVLITLPCWIPGKPVTRELLDRWYKCFIGLSTHEQGHRVLAEAAGTEVEKRLLALPSFPSIRELSAAADDTINKTIEEFRERERKYDQVTRHGATQGAVFPMTAREARK